MERSIQTIPYEAFANDNISTSFAYASIPPTEPFFFLISLKN